MTRCVAISDTALCARHDCPGHPECNERLFSALGGLPKWTPIHAPVPAPEDAVTRVHDPSYVAWLAARCTNTAGLGHLDPDTYITRESYSVALHVAGAAIAAAGRALEGEHCFSLMRPPGHHAEPGRAMGFCLLNNAAIAAASILDRCKRVAIIDWDVHHGNGSQHAFYRSEHVLYCSVHRAWFYPGTESIGERGAGNGEGYTINAPLESGATISDYSAVFSKVFVPVLRRFRPESVIISAGQDILSDDPLGGMAILPQDFFTLTRLIAGAAEVPLALVLEGGYGPSHGKAIETIFSALQSEKDADMPLAPARRSTIEVISVLKKSHRLG